MNVLKALFVGSAKYLETCKKVTDAVAVYTASIGDLCVAIDLATFSQTRQMEASLTNQFEKLSVSTEAQFRNLQEKISRSFNNFTAEANGVTFAHILVNPFV